MAAGHVAPLAEHEHGGAQIGPQETDEQLVARLKAGDRTAFDELYERFFKRIYLFVDRRLRNPADTEETVQEVFMNVLNSIESFRGEAPFAAWVFGLTRRTIAGRFKRKRHATVPLMDDDHEQLAQPPGIGAASPVEAYEYQELVQQIESKFENKLSPEQRQLFELHHLEERSISEIASRLDKTENAVKSNLYRARKILLAR